jgi:hypothetical protein
MGKITNRSDFGAEGNQEYEGPNDFVARVESDGFTPRRKEREDSITDPKTSEV